MKNLGYYIVGFSILFFLNSVFAGAVIFDFAGEKGFNQVTLKWKARAESNLKNYEVERSLDGITFTKIGDVAPTSSVENEKTYTYVDRSVFKGTTHTFHYRIKIVDNDGSSSYTKTVTVTPEISSARFTWGSIKAMFR